MIDKRLSDLSCNNEEYGNKNDIYQNNNHKQQRQSMEIKMTYIKTATTNIRNRARNIVWFNAPYTQNFKINIGKTFLNLIKKHFPKLIDYIKYSIEIH